MYQLKIIKLLTRLYLWSLRLALRSLVGADEKALKRLNEDLNFAEQVRENAKRLREKATAIEDESNANYTRESGKINADYHTIANLHDDVEALQP